MGDNKIVTKDNRAFGLLKKSLIGLGVVGGLTFLWWGISSMPFVKWGISKLVTGCHTLGVLFGYSNIYEFLNDRAKKMMKAPGKENIYICRYAFESDPASYFRNLRN